MRPTARRCRRHRPPRRTTALGLAALLAAGALSLAPSVTTPAQAEEESSEGAGGGDDAVPFGEQIEPGTTIQDTAPVETGTYALPVPEPGEDQFFEVERTEPGQVIWYGVTAILDEVPLEDAALRVVGLGDGDESLPCDDSTVAAEPVSISTSLYNANRSSNCREADSIVLQVVNQPGLSGPPLPTGGFYQLTVWTEPDVENRDELPGANESSPWVQGEDRHGVEAEEVEGATTFTDAAELASGGVYDLTVRQGRPAIFAFPLTYGQHAQVEVEVLEGADTFESVEPVWVTPLGGQVRRVAPAGGPMPALSIDAETDDDPAGWSTPIIGYLNRERIGLLGSTGGTGSGGFQASPAAFAGTYFLVVELPSDTEFSDFPEEITVRMAPDVITDYEGTVPDYVQEPTPLSALDGSGFVATAEEEQAAREQRAEPAPWGLVGGLFAGAVLLAVVGGIAIGRVMRRSA